LTGGGSARAGEAQRPKRRSHERFISLDTGQ
jgi:hypothetical protein